MVCDNAVPFGYRNVTDILHSLHPISQTAYSKNEMHRTDTSQTDADKKQKNQQIEEEVGMMEVEQKRRSGNILTGTVGAFLGSLIGVACIVIMGQLGYVASLSGVVMAVCALKGYELLGGKLTKVGVVISAALLMAMTYFAYRLDYAIAVAKVYEIGIPESFSLIGLLVQVEDIDPGAFWGNLAMLYLFTLVGAVPTIISGLKSGQPPLLPTLQTESAEEPLTIQPLQIHSAQKGRLTPLKTGVNIAVFLPILVTLGTIVYAVSAQSAPLWIGVSVGALISAFAVMCFLIPTFALFQADNLLLVRDASGLLWRVSLNQLNVMAPYRFTQKGALRALCWDSLSTEEQEQANDSIVRAITALRTGDPDASSGLGNIVIPLTDLELVKEDARQWKTTYLAPKGRKSLSIPKVYPDLRPAPGAETASHPIPFASREIIISIACMLLFAAVGGIVASGMRSGSAASGRSDVSEPARPAAASAFSPSSTPGTQSSTAPIPTDRAVPDEITAITAENYQTLFQPAVNMGYTHVGLAYYKAPIEQYGREAFVEAYLPYGDELTYSQDGYVVESSAHGISIRQTTVFSAENAKSVVDKAYEDLLNSGVIIQEEYTSETEYSEEYDTACKSLIISEKGSENFEAAILYADVKENSHYLSAQITYLPELIDAEFPALLEELSDAFAFSLPNILES